MNAKITVENICGDVVIAFNGIPHLHFRFLDYRALHSWKNSDKHFCIEIFLTDGVKIEADYDSREKWQTIISGIAKAIAQ